MLNALMGQAFKLQRGLDSYTRPCIYALILKVAYEARIIEGDRQITAKDLQMAASNVQHHS